MVYVIVETLFQSFCCARFDLDEVIPQVGPTFLDKGQPAAIFYECIYLLRYTYASPLYPGHPWLKQRLTGSQGLSDPL